MSHYPEVKSGDLFKTSLIAMPAVQRKILSQTFIDDARSSTYFAAQCGKLAIASAALTLASIAYNSSFNKRTAHQKSEEKEVSWAATFVLLGVAGTAFFTYQWVSHSVEAQRLQDLSEFINEWPTEKGL